MQFYYALSMALAGSALAQASVPTPVSLKPLSTPGTSAKTSLLPPKSSLSPAAASSAAASVASKVVSEINAAASAASTANSIAKTLNPNNAISVGPQVAGGISTIIEDFSAATSDLAAVVSSKAPTAGKVAFNPSACVHADDPQSCVNDAVSKLALPADEYSGSIAGRAAQASSSGSESFSFTINQQAAIANAYKSAAALQSTLAATIEQERANVGAYLIPIRNSVIVLQGTADALALAIQNDVSSQFDTIVSQARSSLDSQLAVTIKAYASAT